MVPAKQIGIFFNFGFYQFAPYYHININNWRGRGGYGRGGRVNHIGGYNVNSNNDYGKKSDINDNLNTRQISTTGGQ